MDENFKNPYAAPQVASITQPGREVIFAPASLGLRFLNFLIDTVVYFLLLMAVVLVLSLVLSDIEIFAEEPMSTIITYAFMILYYSVMEATFGRTVAKFITGTKVVNARGEKPTWGQAFGRSLCRLIPFEPFSMFRSEHRGWHDTIPGTWVVNLRRPL
jgi:uncharacterized RDD family membrane protein YckC